MPGGRLAILAGGISSRMKKSNADGAAVDESLISDANNKTKSMIGVGKDKRPFLDYLLYNAREAGYKDVVIVVGERDESIRNYYGPKDRDNDFFGLNISYAIQFIPAGRQKPLGTADALLQGLKAKTDWSGGRFTVCNSDNLYSVKALRTVRLDDHQNVMIDYDRNALQFPWSRIERFAVTLKDDAGYLTDIIEKPTEDEIKSAAGRDGFVGVSMNIFGLQYDMFLPYLERVPPHPVRDEKELPEAVKLMARDRLKSVYTIPLSEHVPDLTDKGDILPVKEYLETHFANSTF
jgi:glucose-1-phosphate thymidylyltransferase